MRTQQEIIDRIKANEEDMFFGMVVMDLLQYLSFDNAKQFLKEDVTIADWEADKLPRQLTEENVKDEMIDYLDFAFEKAHGERGLSAGRSMYHYTNWFWLLGDDVLEEIGDLMQYENYGLAHLCRIAKYLEQEVPA